AERRGSGKSSLLRLLLGFETPLSSARARSITCALTLARPRLDPLYAGLIANVTAYEDLALDAALRGGAGAPARP
ncbi:hypothetical protein, partial [Streptomyces bambusae]